MIDKQNLINKSNSLYDVEAIGGLVETTPIATGLDKTPEQVLFPPEEPFPPDNNEIYYRRSVDNGVTWGSINKLVESEFDSRAPKAVPEGTGKFHVVWYEIEPEMGNGTFYHNTRM